MKQTRSQEQILLEQLEDLKIAHKNRQYLKVVILSPQLTVEIINVLSSYNDYWYEKKILSEISTDDKEIYKIAAQLQKKESDRSYIVGALVEYFTEGMWGEGKSKPEFLKYFTKLDDLISLRNIYAHEFYIKNISERRAKNCSRSGIEIAELFAKELNVEP